MFKLCLDIFAINIILYLVEGDDDIDFVHNALVVIGIGVVNLSCALFLADKLGALTLPLVVVVDGLILMRFCYLTLKQTVMTLILLGAYNFLFELLWNWAVES